MSKKLRIYLRGTGTGTVAEIVQKITGFISVWLLNQVLVKGQYGDYEFALALVSMVLILGSGGLQNVAMYRLSRLDAPAEKLAGRELAGTLLGLSLAIAVITAVLLVAALPLVTSVAGKSSLRFWIAGLVLLIPLRVARGIYKNWYEARQLIAESLIYSKIAPSSAKIALLLIVWAIWREPMGVVMAVILSEALPLFWWYLKNPINIIPSVRLLSWWDIRYALKLIITRSLSKTNKRADILMMGGIATSVATAEYVIASKLSMVTLASHKIMNKVLRPRVGKFLSNNSILSIEDEYNRVRMLSLLYSFLFGAFICYAGVYLLGIFGDYESAYRATMILVSTYIVTTSFGMNGEYLNIAGYASWSLLVTFITLFANISLNYLFIPTLSEVGASLAMFISIVITNSLCGALIYNMDGVSVYSFEVFAYTMVSVCALLLAGFGITKSVVSSAIIIVLCIFIVWSNREDLKNVYYEWYV